MSKKLTVAEAARLGAAMRRRRDALGISREELGRLIDLSTSRIQQYERGWHRQYGHEIVSSPPVPMLRRIAEALDTSAPDILREADLVDEGTEIPGPLEVTGADLAPRIQGDAASTKKISLKIQGQREQWDRFLATLSPEAKGELLTLFATGQVESTGPPE